MAPKTKIQIDPLKAQYKTLKEINQRIRYISDVYYMAFNNFIYMHSNVEFLEKVAIIHNTIDISSYQGIMYLPNELFNFTKEAKMTKLITNDLQSSIHLGQIENDEMNIKLNRIYIPNDEVKEEDNINLTIIPKMYTKFHHYFNEINDLKYELISLNDTESISKNSMVFINTPLCTLSLSKNLFGSLKKENVLSYHMFSSKEDSNKIYVIYKEENEEMNIYTLCAYLNM